MLLFTVTHQTSELWLKLAVSEAYQIANFLAEDNFRMAMRLVPRILMCIEFADEGMAMLDQMTPWDYQQVRRALGHGSGFDSPGFNAIRKAIPTLGKEFHRLLNKEGVELLTIFLEQVPRFNSAKSKWHSLRRIDISNDAISANTGIVQKSGILSASTKTFGRLEHKFIELPLSRVIKEILEPWKIASYSPEWRHQ